MGFMNNFVFQYFSISVWLNWAKRVDSTLLSRALCQTSWFLYFIGPHSWEPARSLELNLGLFELELNFKEILITASHKDDTVKYGKCHKNCLWSYEYKNVYSTNKPNHFVYGHDKLEVLEICWFELLSGL